MPEEADKEPSTSDGYGNPAEGCKGIAQVGPQVHYSLQRLVLEYVEGDLELQDGEAKVNMGGPGWGQAQE